MPEAIETLYIALDLAKEKYEAGLNQVESQTASFTNRTSDILKGLALGGLGAAAIGLAKLGTEGFNFASTLQGSLKDVQSQLGLTADETKQLGDVAKGVFANNFGDNIEDVTQSVADVQKNFAALGVSSQADLKGATEAALALRDTFDIDIAESSSAAASLMKQFGLTSQEAFDFIAKGQQEGLNINDDFLDSIGEYSVQFAESGYTADKFFSILQSGLGGAALGTDFVADAFKEARIRIMEMPEGIADSWKAVAGGIAESLNVDEFATGEAAVNSLKEAFGEFSHLVTEDFTKGLQDGSSYFSDTFQKIIIQGINDGTLTVAKAEELLLTGLKNIDNQVQQNSLGVSFFGTKWEDLGASGLLSIDMLQTSMDDMEGATASMNVRYDNMGALIEGVWRRILVSMEPFMAKLLELGNKLIPYLFPIIDAIPTFFEKAFGYVNSILKVGMQWYNEINRVGEQVFGEDTPDTLNSLMQVIDKLGQVFQAFGALATQIWSMVSSLISQHSSTIQAITSTLGSFMTNSFMNTLNVIIGLFTAATALLKGDWQGFGQALVSIGTSFWDQIKNVFSTSMSLLDTVTGGGVGRLIDVWHRLAAIPGIVSDKLNQTVSIVRETIGSIPDIAWSALDRLSGAVRERFNDVVNISRDKIRALPDIVRGMGDSLYESGRALIGNLWEGIADRFGQLIDDARRKFEELRRMLPFSEPKDPYSPFRNLAKSGESIIGNIQDGIDAATLTIPSVDVPETSHKIATVNQSSTEHRVHITFEGLPATFDQGMVEQTVRDVFTTLGSSAFYRKLT